MLRSRPALALLAVVVPLLAAEPAQATYAGASTDPAGDAADPSPARDLVGAEVGYDARRGTFVAEVRLRDFDLAGTRTFLTVVAATSTPTGCNGPAAAFGALTDASSAQWNRFADPTTVTARGPASHRGRGLDVHRFSVEAPALRGLSPDCAQVVLADADDATKVLDTIGPFRVRPYAGLELALGTLPRTVDAGRTHRLRIVVRNPGSAPTGRVRLRLAKTRGLTASKRSVTLPSIAPGGRRTASVRVTLGRNADTGSDIAVTARAGRLSAEAKRRVLVRKPRRPAPRGGGAPGSPSVCTRWFPDFSGESGGSLGLVPCPR